MNEHTIFVGLDVHKATIAVAVAEGRDGSVRSVGTIPNRPDMVAKAMRKLGPLDRLSVAYEAGPCGYVVYRQLTDMGVLCMVVAPSLIPVKPGDRVKTDRRDALKLARLLRSRDLSPVWVPDEEHEALRDLTRAREDAREDLLRVRNRLLKLLLRQGVQEPTGLRRWTVKYRRWLQPIKLAYPSTQLVVGEYLLAIDQAEERLARLEKELAEAAKNSVHAPVIAALMAMRGVGLITAVTLVAELGDLTRFLSPRQLMGYVGLGSRESSSGPRQRRGSITKTGNSHARFMAIEAAWHYRHRPAVGQALKKRQEGQSERVKAISYKAQDRLHRRYRRLMNRGLLAQKVVVAVARELLGFMWAISQEVARAQESSKPAIAA